MFGFPRQRAPLAGRLALPPAGTEIVRPRRRRRLVGAILAAVLLLAGLLAASTASAQQRLPIHDPLWAEGSSRLADWREGIELMQARDRRARADSGYLLSWRFAINTHGHYGPDCAGSIPAARAGTGLRTWTQDTAAEDRVWCSCLHRVAGFLPWHRMMLRRHEQIIARLIEDTNFRLPYWDPSVDGRLPVQFTTPTYIRDGVERPNPLYVAQRAPGMNERTSRFTAAGRNLDDELEAQTYAEFSTRMEEGFHGYIHSALGGRSGWMSSLAVAAGDPFFYILHGSVDAYWERWREGPNHPGTPQSVLNASYSFAGASGQIVTTQVSRFITLRQMGYSYPPEFLETAALPDTTVWKAQGQSNERLRLKLTLEVPENPGGTLYEVWLVRGARRALAGTVSFFGADQHGGHGDHGAPDEITFDVRALEAVRALGLPPGRVRADPGLVQIELRPTTGLEPVPEAAPSRRAPPAAPPADIPAVRGRAFQ